MYSVIRSFLRKPRMFPIIFWSDVGSCPSTTVERPTNTESVAPHLYQPSPTNTKLRENLVIVLGTNKKQ